MHNKILVLINSFPLSLTSDLCLPQNEDRMHFNFMYLINVLIWSASFREELVSFCRGAILVSPGLLGWALLRRGMRMLGLMVSSFWQATSPSFLQLLEPQPGHKEKEGGSVSSNLGSSLRLYCKISSGVSICKKHRAAVCVFSGLLKAASSTWQVLTS